MSAASPTAPSPPEPAAPTSASPESEHEQHVRRLERERARSGAAAFAWALAFAVVPFFAFALGALYGPFPLAREELLGGALLALAFGLVLQAATVRRATEHDARLVARVREGDKGRRVAVFEHHLWIDDAVALRPVRGARLAEDNTLRIELVDADGAALTRTFTGRRQVLAALRDELSADLAGAASADGGAPDTWTVGRSGLRG